MCLAVQQTRMVAKVDVDEVLIAPGYVVSILHVVLCNVGHELGAAESRQVHEHDAGIDAWISIVVGWDVV